MAEIFSSENYFNSIFILSKNAANSTNNAPYSVNIGEIPEVEQAHRVEVA
jgi:hypothetical protein